MSSENQQLHQALILKRVRVTAITVVVAQVIGLLLALAVVAALGGTLNDKTDAFLSPVAAGAVSGFGYLGLLLSQAVAFSKEKVSAQVFASRLRFFGKYYVMGLIVLSAVFQVVLNTNPGEFSLARVTSYVVGFALTLQGVFVVSRAHRRLLKVLRHRG